MSDVIKNPTWEQVDEFFRNPVEGATFKFGGKDMIIVEDPDGGLCVAYLHTAAVTDLHRPELPAKLAANESQVVGFRDYKGNLTIVCGNRGTYTRRDGDWVRWGADISLEEYKRHYPGQTMLSREDTDKILAKNPIGSIRSTQPASPPITTVEPLPYEATHPKCLICKEDIGPQGHCMCPGTGPKVRDDSGVIKLVGGREIRTDGWRMVCGKCGGPSKPLTMIGDCPASFFCPKCDSLPDVAVASCQDCRHKLHNGQKYCVINCHCVSNPASQPSRPAITKVGRCWLNADGTWETDDQWVFLANSNSTMRSTAKIKHHQTHTLYGWPFDELASECVRRNPRKGDEFEADGIGTLYKLIDESHELVG